MVVNSRPFGGTIEEIWLPAEGDVMHAVFRAVAGGTMSFSEFIQVTVEDGGVVMRFAHFRRDYSTWEGDGPPMELRLASAEEGHAVFEATNEVTPDRIEYRRVDARTLEARVTGIDAPLVFRRVD